VPQCSWFSPAKERPARQLEPGVSRLSFVHTMPMSPRNSQPPVSLARRDELARALRSLVDHANGKPRTGGPWWSLLKDAESTLTAIVNDEVALEDFCSERMRGDGSGFSRLSTTALVNWLMDRTLDVGPDTTISDLEQYLNSRTFPTRFSIGVRGVTVTAPIQMADGIDLLPHSDDVASFEPSDNPPTSTAALTLVVQFP